VLPSFASRVASLPVLGLGVSTEYGAQQQGEGQLDPLELRRLAPQRAAFLEVGVEVVRGLDSDSRAWVAAGLPTTYHFLDVNLDEPEDQDINWLAGVRALIAELRPAWLCGDAGLWHFGPRDRGHMLLLPPILTADAADAIAAGIRSLRQATGLEVLPENPPGTVYLGDMTLPAFFQRVAEQADCGLLLDLAHLGIYQRQRGQSPLADLELLELDRVVEVHVAGGVVRDHQGFAWVEDQHGPELLDDTWQLLEWLTPRAPNLRAVVFECERNPLPALVPTMDRIERALRHSPLLAASVKG
jgi:uncharacterized protein